MPSAAARVAASLARGSAAASGIGGTPAAGHVSEARGRGGGTREEGKVREERRRAGGDVGRQARGDAARGAGATALRNRVERRENAGDRNAPCVWGGMPEENGLKTAWK